MALLVGIRTVKDVEIVKMLHSGIVMLSHYQDGVGNAIELPGVGMGDVTKLSPDELKSVMAGYDFEKWTHFSELMQAEQARNEGLVKEAKEANPLFGRSDQSPSWFASIAIAARRIFSGARI